MTLDRTLQLHAIRVAAKGLVGPDCTDYQIMFCGKKAGRINTMFLTLEELSDTDVAALATWIVGGFCQADAAPQPESEFDLYRRFQSAKDDLFEN